MSIDIMHFLKKWKRRIMFVAVFLVFLSLVLKVRTITKQPLSSPTLTRIQEVLPQHPYILWQEKKERFQTYIQTTDSDISFTLHPGLFDGQWSTGNHLISGNLSWITERKETVQGSGTSSFAMTLDGTLEGIRDENTATQITNHLYIVGLVDRYDIYIMIKESSLSQVGKISDTLSLRSLLLKQYQDKRIRIPRSTIHYLGVLSPSYIQQQIDANAKKVRIIPNAPGGGRAYSISGDTTSLTGYWQSDTDNALHISLFPRDIVTNITHTHIPDIRNVHVYQDNEYGMQFDGTVQQRIQRNMLLREIKGEALWPGGIRMNISHDIMLKKSPLQQYIPPKQFLEWENIFPS